MLATTKRCISDRTRKSPEGPNRPDRLEGSRNQLRRTGKRAKPAPPRDACRPLGSCFEQIPPPLGGPRSPKQGQIQSNSGTFRGSHRFEDVPRGGKITTKPAPKNRRFHTTGSLLPSYNNAHPADIHVKPGERGCSISPYRMFRRPFQGNRMFPSSKTSRISPTG